MYPIQIEDIYTGNESWRALNAKANGMRGVIVKAGQGQLEYRWRPFVEDIKANGLPWGLYWVVDARYSPESHKFAIKQAFPDGNFGPLGLWLDIEKPEREMRDIDYMALPYAFYKPIESIWRGVHAYTGEYPGWYISPGMWKLACSKMPLSLQDEIASKTLLWTAQYNSFITKPDLYGGWKTWCFWQYRPDPDYNFFNGSEQEFLDTFNLDVAEPPQTGEPMYLGTVLASPRMNIRSTPSVTSTNDIGDLLFGDNVEADRIENDWWHLVTVNNVAVPRESWAFAKAGEYIRLDSVTTPPAEPEPVWQKATLILEGEGGKKYQLAGNLTEVP